VLESMPDEEYNLEGVNLGPQEVNPARGDIIRPTMKIIWPGPGESWPGLAGTVSKGSPTGFRIPACPGKLAWANSGLGSDPDALEWRPGGGAAYRSRPGHAGPAGEGKAARPGLACWPGRGRS
jgi:hypothetical protein